MSYLNPINNKIVVQTITLEIKTESGLILPEHESQTLMGKVKNNGKCSQIQNHDTVIFNKYSGVNITIDSEDYLILDEKDVLAIVRE